MFPDEAFIKLLISIFINLHTLFSRLLFNYRLCLSCLQINLPAVCVAIFELQMPSQITWICWSAVHTWTFGHNCHIYSRKCHTCHAHIVNRIHPPVQKGSVTNTMKKKRITILYRFPHCLYTRTKTSYPISNINQR